MQNLTFGRNYSGIGPSSFNKRQLFEIIRMSGRKTSKTVDSTRDSLVREASRARGSKSWSTFYYNGRVQRYSNV